MQSLRTYVYNAECRQSYSYQNIYIHVYMYVEAMLILSCAYRIARLMNGDIYTILLT